MKAAATTVGAGLLLYVFYVLMDAWNQSRLRKVPIPVKKANKKKR